MRHATHGRTFYHGTRLDDARAIERNGFNIGRRRGRGAALGAGVYMSAKQEWAADYANDVLNGDLDRQGIERDAGILHLRLNVDRFLDISDPANWPADLLADYGAPVSPIDWLSVGRFARRNGYGGVGNPAGALVVYDPSAITIVKIEEIFRRTGE